MVIILMCEYCAVLWAVLHILAVSKRFLKRLLLQTIKIWSICLDLGSMQEQPFLKTLQHREYISIEQICTTSVITAALIIIC